MRFLFLTFLLLATPLRAFECGGDNLLDAMAPEDRAAIEARAETYPFANGLFWRATRGDTRLTLFGTYHFFHRETEAHLAALLPHASDADLAYFEMSYEDQKHFERLSQTDPSILFITEGPTIPEIMEEADWQRLRARMAELGIPSFMAAKFKPIFVAMMLSSSPCLIRAQTSGAKGIDEALARRLHDDGIPTRSIEDVSTIVELLDSFSRGDQVGMIKLSLDLPQDPDDLQATMLDLYLDGRVALLWEYAKLLSLQHGSATAEADFARFEQALLTDRNRAWADRVEAEMVGKSALIAVGAGHLPGENGLLNLLARRGFTITPLELATE